jgi:hypothetical protein
MTRAALLLAAAALLLAYRQRQRRAYIETTPEADVLVPNDRDEFTLWEDYFRSLEDEA